MNKDLIKFTIKLFIGMLAIGAGGTLVKKAGKDACQLSPKGGNDNA